MPIRPTIAIDLGSTGRHTSRVAEDSRFERSVAPEQSNVSLPSSTALVCASSKTPQLLLKRPRSPLFFFFSGFFFPSGD